MVQLRVARAMVATIIRGIVKVYIRRVMFSASRRFALGAARSMSRMRSGGRVAGTFARSQARGIARWSDKEVDNLINNITRNMDPFEMIEFAYDLESSIENIQAAGVQAGIATWSDAMSSMNPGQKVLTQEYCIPITEEFGMSGVNWDKEQYLMQLYSAHEAIPYALSETASDAYDAMIEAAEQALLEALGGYAAASGLSKFMDDDDFYSSTGDYSSAMARAGIKNYIGSPYGYTGKPGQHDYSDGAMFQPSSHEFVYGYRGSNSAWARQQRSIYGEY